MQSPLKKRTGYTFRELEKLTEKQGHKVTYAAIQAIESGLKPNPTVQTVQVLAKVFNVKPGWLAFGE